METATAFTRGLLFSCQGRSRPVQRMYACCFLHLVVCYIDCFFLGCKGTFITKAFDAGWVTQNGSLGFGFDPISIL